MNSKQLILWKCDFCNITWGVSKNFTSIFPSNYKFNIIAQCPNCHRDYKIHDNIGLWSIERKVD